MFGDYIRRLRKYSNMTQEQLAEKMEVSKTTVQNWESGRTKVKTAHLKRLAYLFNVSISSLILELNRENDLMRKETFPFFLFDDSEVDIFKTLHLNLNQQELFGLICLYYPDLLQDYIDRGAVFDETLTRIPYEFICKVGSIQYMNLADGLKNVLKYVQPKFLLKVLKLYPDELFDLTRLPKELIIEFLDSGHVPFSEDEDAFEEYGFDFYIDMKKASIVLPILEKGAVHIANGDENGKPLGSDVLSNDIPQEIVDASRWTPNEKCLLTHVYSGIESITTIRCDKSKRYLEINDLGRELLEWFKEKE